MSSTVRMRHRLRYPSRTLLAAALVFVTTGPLAADEEPEWDVNPSAVEFTKMAIPLMGTTLGIMLAVGDREDSDAARYCLDAMLTADLAAEALKRITRQPRPYKPEAEDGFPSGHTTVAFAFARSLAEWHPDASPVLYAFAATSAWARVQEGQHTWAQVLAGAALGTWLADRSVEASGGIWFGTVAPAQETMGLQSASCVGRSPSGFTIWDTTW